MKKFFLALSLGIIILGTAHVVLGQGQPVTLTNPLKAGEDFRTILEAIGKWLIQLGLPLAILMVTVGGFQIMVSGGEPDKITKGRRTILWTAVGYGILVIGWGITKIIESLINSTP